MHNKAGIEERLEIIERQLCSLILQGEYTMTIISDFAAAQTAFNDRMDIAITDLQGDIKSLNDQIAALIASAGEISAEDKASLDALQARASGMADKLDALDALTPPVVPAA